MYIILLSTRELISDSSSSFSFYCSFWCSFSSRQPGRNSPITPSRSILTLLCAYMADPSSFQVPPLRSMRSIRRICRKRRLRRDVANTLPWLRTATTGTEAISTKMSDTEETQHRQSRKVSLWLMSLTRHTSQVFFVKWRRAAELVPNKSWLSARDAAEKPLIRFCCSTWRAVQWVVHEVGLKWKSNFASF